MTDTIIDGEYRIESQIGEGAFGVVYRCREIRLDRPVAVKMLGRSGLGERELSRFLAEARNLAALNHPNVVQIYRLGSHEGNPYLVMELLTGCTLRQLLRNERLPLTRGLEIARCVARGLGAIHETGIVHRDLSTNNVMIDSSDGVKILDLGLARDMSSLATISAEHFLAGTVPYVAPEQILGASPSQRSDLFSFGVILYEVITGRNPFAADHFMSALYNISNRDPEPIEAFMENAPPALSRLVNSCLAKIPEDRPGSAREIESALTAILAASGLADIRSIPRPSEPAMRGCSVRNPYLSRVMIKQHASFYGRRQEVKRIYARLGATPPGSVSVVGDRKIGKSSLLNYVYMRQNRAEYLEQPETLVMVFIDLQEQREITIDGFVRQLVGMAEFELRGRLEVSDCRPDLEGVKDLVQRLDRAGYRLAILLDEFEAVTRNARFDPQFFSFLRYLANHYNVAYVTSSARDLQVLCHTKEVSDSPFFNIFSTLRLTAFRLEEARELIREPSARVGKPLVAWSDAILDLSGLLPLYCQMACSHAIEQLDESSGSALDLDDLRRRFLEEAEPHFRSVWESFSDDEQVGARRVASGRSLPPSLRHVVEGLARRGYVTGEENAPVLFSSCFAQFVRSREGAEARPGFLRRLLGKG